MTLHAHHPSADRRASLALVRATASTCVFLLAACQPSEPDDSAFNPGLPQPEADSGEDDDDDPTENPDGPQVPDGEDDDAEIVTFEYPDLMPCAAWDSIRLVVRNTGVTTWSANAGYSLVALDAGAPFTAPTTRMDLPEAVEVTPGGTWSFELSVQAPEQDGSYTSSWQMARDEVAFGPMASGQISVDCSAPIPEPPDRFDVVEMVAQEYGHLLEINTYESCGEFVQRVLMALDDDWGHVGKTAGEAQHTPEGFEPHHVEGHLITGFSHDVIYHRTSDRQIDIIVNASANSDHDPAIWGPASISWQLIPQEHHRDNNPWIPTVAIE
jgi:hypothetical protein